MKLFRPVILPLVVILMSAPACRTPTPPAAASEHDRLETAAAALRAGDFATSESIVRALLREQPGSTAALNLLGEVQAGRGELARARETFRDVIGMSRSAGDAEREAVAHGNLAAVEFALGEAGRAERSYYRALDLWEETDDRESMAFDYGNLGLMYHAQRRWENAEMMYGKALEIRLAAGDLAGIAAQHANLGLLAEARGDWGRAGDHFAESLAACLRGGDEKGAAEQYASLGGARLARGDTDGAREALENSREMYEKLELAHHAAEIGERLARLEPAPAPDQADAETNPEDTERP